VRLWLRAFLSSTHHPLTCRCSLPSSVDVDAHPEVAASFGVRSVPFLTLLRAGAWFSHDHQGEPVPLPPARYEGPLTAGATAAWLANRRASAHGGRVGHTHPAQCSPPHPFLPSSQHGADRGLEAICGRADARDDAAGAG